ncbi:GAF domain-containing protein [Lipingzhangella halophila]|uniref:GAF domain-containing protein n=1 Tax=Lipingzhangella halophila TaxID=1783352 RepID=A0A7W7RCQ5_9ACTN|nr:helix-turn-helix domain-containing protein [Lipingzhangella halophila]MBB4929586.1 GAF domain-containing protein [Lipingzhangella halophila]
MDGYLNEPAAAERTEHGETAFLDLLLRDAPAVEYERPLVRARANRADPGRLAELERAKLLALRVRAVLSESQRRESELAALFETANDLAGMRNLDQVLRAIVDRARALLGTDTSYLTLTDQVVGDTAMRVTSGSVSARFQRLRLGPGEGLGGLVAQTALPYVTANYPEDDRFRHTETIDSGVAEEGLVAILGVPLLLNGQVIGVLFAANRRERPFVHSEIALLGSLAAHAAIAIDTANLIDGTHAALNELNAVNEQLQEHNTAVERAADAHDRLAELVLRGGGVDEVAATIREVLGGEVRIHDAAAVWDGEDAQPDLAAAVEESLGSGRVARAGDAWVAAAAAGTELLGTLTLRGVDLADADQRILERAAMVIALLLLLRRSVNEAEHRLRGDLLEEVLDSPDRDPDLLQERAGRLATDLDAAHVVVVAEAASANAARLRSAATHLAETKHGLAGVRHGRTVLVLPGTDPVGVGRYAAAELRAAANAPVTAGVAGPTTGLDTIPGRYGEALRCVRALRSLDRDGEVASPDELGFLGLLLSTNRQAPEFVAATLGPLLEYDEQRGTALVATLRAYFACGANLSRTKRELRVHVNTVAQRLERIGQLIGADWQDPERALELQLALRLHRLLDGGVDLDGGGGAGARG